MMNLKPMSCVQCGQLLLGEDSNPVRHQVTGLPLVEPELVDTGDIPALWGQDLC